MCIRDRPKATAIVCDENDMGYIKGMANLKADVYKRQDEGSGSGGDF